MRRPHEIDGIITIKRRMPDGSMKLVFKVELMDALGQGQSYVMFQNKESKLTKDGPVSNTKIFDRARRLYRIARKG